MVYCSKCGSALQEGANFCPKCGTPAAHTAAQAGTPLEAGHGALILVLGILSLIMLGPFTGIPAWVMGARDLKKIREGKIASSEQPMTQVGMVLGIVGTVLGVIALGIVLVAFLILFGMLSTVAGGFHDVAGAALLAVPVMLPHSRRRA